MGAGGVSCFGFYLYGDGQRLDFQVFSFNRSGLHASIGSMHHSPALREVCRMTPIRASLLSATSLVTALGVGVAPVHAAVIYSITGTNLSGLTYAIGDRVSAGVGYTYVDGSSVSATLTTTNLTTSTISTSATATAGTAVVSLASIPSSIGSKGTDNFNVRVVPAARGSMTGAFTYSAFGAGGFTSGSPDKTTITVNTTAVAPVANVTGAPVYLMANSGATGTTAVIISNAGDGNLSGLGTSSNLSAATNTRTLGTGWSGTVANTASLADKASSSAGTLSYTAQATRGAATITTVTSTFTNGNPSGTNKAATVTTTLTGQTVAPVASVTSALSFGNVRVGTTTTASLVVRNTGDGNLAGADNGTTRKTNLRGSVGTGSGMFSGGSATFSLTDTTGGQSATNASSTYTFTYSPTARSASDTVNVTTTLTNGATSGNAGGTATTTLSGTAVGPGFSVDLGKSGSAQDSGNTIKFGDLAGGVYLNNLLIKNISNDNASPALTNMTVTATIIGDAASEFSFSLSGFQTPTLSTGVLRNVFNGADLGNIAVQFVSKYGPGSAQLRIQTDEQSTLGVMGSQVYVYDLIGTIPEPGTMMVLGTGLLGLAFARRRQRIAALTEADDARPH